MSKVGMINIIQQHRGKNVAARMSKKLATEVREYYAEMMKEVVAKEELRQAELQKAYDKCVDETIEKAKTVNPELHKRLVAVPRSSVMAVCKAYKEEKIIEKQLQEQRQKWTSKTHEELCLTCMDFQKQIVAMEAMIKQMEEKIEAHVISKAISDRCNCCSYHY